MGNENHQLGLRAVTRVPAKAALQDWLLSENTDLSIVQESHEATTSMHIQAESR
jgi:hypothetical protein